MSGITVRNFPPAGNLNFDQMVGRSLRCLVLLNDDRTGLRDKDHAVGSVQDAIWAFMHPHRRVTGITSSMHDRVSASEKYPWQSPVSSPLLPSGTLCSSTPSTRGGGNAGCRYLRATHNCDDADTLLLRIVSRLLTERFPPLLPLHHCVQYPPYFSKKI